MAGPGLQREETIGAREESKSEGSNIVNNNSSGSRSGANKDDSKSEGNSNNNCSGCANSSRCEGKGGPHGRVLKVAESNSMSSAANGGARAGGGGGAAGRGHGRDHCKERSTVQRLGNII